MKRVLGTAALLCLWHALSTTPSAAFAGAAAAAAQYCSGRDVDTTVHNGRAVQLARRWEVVLQDTFDRGLDRWQVRNYENALTIRALDAGSAPGGCRSVLITRKDRKTDTAFELTSQPFPVAAGAACRLTIAARQDMDLHRTAGHKALYWTQIQWLAANGQEVGTTPFTLGGKDETWHECIVQAASPAKTTKAVVRIGFDWPDLYNGRYLQFARIALSIRQEPPRYVPEGELLSRPLLLPAADAVPALAWQADTPPGTAVKCQVRSAPDVGGAPGKWTALCGPDGTAASFHTTSGAPLAPLHRRHRWVQYRVVLSTRDDSATPALREVRVGTGPRALADRAWAGPDRSPPVLGTHSPRRTTRNDAPIVFALADNPGGVGVEHTSVEAYLDGEPITSRLKSQPDGSFRCALPAPLEPGRVLQGFGDWKIRNYEGALTIAAAEPRAPGGLPSLSVGRQGPKRDSAFALVSPRVSVQSGATYRVSYWSRHAMRLGRAGRKPGHYHSGIQWLDAGGKQVGELVSFDFGDATPTWHQDATTHTAPQGAAWAVMSLGWDWPDLFAGAEVAFADPSFEGPHPGQRVRPNLHRVTVRARDLAGNLLCRDWWVLVKEPPAQGVVTVRDDGVVLVDGKPFFPIGMYAVWKRTHNGNDFEKCFAELAAAGFNTAHTYSSARTPDLEEFYAAAHRHGIKVFLACRTGANNRRPQAAVDDVAAEANQPALLAWYLADDTASHISPADLRRVHDAIGDIDPYHITVQADAVGRPDRSRYAAYVDATDGFLPELYPIRSDDNDEVATIIRDMKTIAADLARAGRRKPVWAIVQDFQGWGWKRYPTNAEVRAMTYLAIIHGATGMTYYTYGGWGTNRGATHDPKVWATLKRIAGELAKLHDVLVERDPPSRGRRSPATAGEGGPPQAQRVQIVAGRQTDGLGYPAISTRLKRHGGKSYLLAANSAEAAVRARFALDGVGQSVQVMFEGRAVRTQAGAFEDAFAPYAVHVYSW